MTEWQLIETVPKDGTAVLVNYKLQIFIAAYGKGDTQVACWRLQTIFGDKLHFQPSHWMPLPEPPE